MTISSLLEGALQAELQDARVMRVHRMQEGVSGEAAGGSCGVEFGLASVTVDDVIAGIARMAGIGNAELGVIEDVEGFGAKLDIQALRGLEVLEQRDVEV